MLSLSKWRLLCATLILVSGGATARASIVIPDCPSFNLEPQSEAAGASAGSPNAPEEYPSDIPSKSRDENAKVLNAFMLTHHGSSTGTSANSAGNGGVFDTCAVRSISVVVLLDSSLACWMSGEQCLALPMPPANSLLRPPRRGLCLSA
jgi:hypothetical protein